jgi:uncharacterized protein
MAFSRDGRERLSNGRTFDYGGTIYLSTGDVLWSDRSNPMLTIVSDDVGRHDFLYASCRAQIQFHASQGLVPPRRKDERMSDRGGRRS